MQAASELVARYLQASEQDDIDAVVACFAEDAVVTDEGQTYRGHDGIRAWRETVSSKYVYTATPGLLSQLSYDDYSVPVRLEGDFPGGVVDVVFAFQLRDGLIGKLEI